MRKNGEMGGVTLLVFKKKQSKTKKEQKKKGLGWGFAEMPTKSSKLFWGKCQLTKGPAGRAGKKKPQT